MKINIRKALVSELTRAYATELEKSFDEYYSINAKESNRYFLNAHAIYNEIESRGEEGRSAIVKLLSHPHIRVRVVTAIRAIDLLPDLAAPVLEAPETRVYPWESISASLALKKLRGNQEDS